MKNFNIPKAETKLDKRKYRCIIKYTSKRKFYWDVFVISLAVWNAIFIPFDIAFKPKISTSVGFIILNGFIDFLFGVDILINMRTSYYDKEGNEIKEWKKILKQYVFGGRFIIDFLSTIPLDEMTGGNITIFQMFGMLKLVRISRMSIIINKLNLKEDLKALIKVCKLLFFLFLYLHAIACVFFFIVNDKKIFVPPLDFISYLDTDYYITYIERKYWISLYIALLMLGGNEIGPRSILEMVFVTFIMLGSAIVNATVFGEMAVLVELIQRKDT